MDFRLSAIHLYPVKGIGGVSPTRAEVNPQGLAHDRRWLIVDSQGQFVSQRTQPRLAVISGSFDGRRLTLAAPGRDSLDLEVPGGNDRLDVTVWRDSLSAAAVGHRADNWISEYLDQECRLAYMDRKAIRPISSSAGQSGETVSFADGYPCLLISNASLADLNSRLATPVPMNRFRPNLVVDGCGAFAEDSWRLIGIGGAVFRFAGLCPRCVVTTVDQASGARVSEEPLRTLGQYRQRETGVVFGVNLVPEKSGAIAVGDPVTVLA
jgi:uncharacterized protein YcbX